MGYASMMDLLTLIPRDLNNDIEELVSGVGAMKMKHFYISRNPWWGRWVEGERKEERERKRGRERERER